MNTPKTEKELMLALATTINPRGRKVRVKSTSNQFSTNINPTTWGDGVNTKDAKYKLRTNDFR